MNKYEKQKLLKDVSGNVNDNIFINIALIKIFKAHTVFSRDSKMLYKNIFSLCFFTSSLLKIIKKIVYMKGT